VTTRISEFCDDTQIGNRALEEQEAVGKGGSHQRRDLEWGSERVGERIGNASGNGIWNWTRKEGGNGGGIGMGNGVRNAIIHHDRFEWACPGLPPQHSEMR
jgi:hypothetical protein